MKLQLLKLITILTVFTMSTAAKECDFVKPTVELPENYSSNLNILEIATRALSYTADGIAYTTDMTELQKVDRRKKKTKSSPAYLDAVGRITVYSKNGQVNNCSGTLISTKPGQASRTIQTAGHCFGSTKTLQKFDIEKIVWETTTKSGQKISKDLTIEMLNLSADDAVLSFNGKIPFSTIKPALVEAEVVLEVGDMILYNDNANLVVAGYSSDNYKGDNGKTLTYDDGISLRNYRYRPDFYLIDSVDSVVFSGASGGAVLIGTDLSDEDIQNPYGQMFYAGTIIQLDATGTHLYKESKDKNASGGKRLNFRSYEIIEADLINKLNK